MDGYIFKQHTARAIPNAKSMHNSEGKKQPTKTKVKEANSSKIIPISVNSIPFSL